MLGSLIGIVVVGGLIDRRGLGSALRRRHRAVRDRPDRRRPRAVDAGARRRAVPPGSRGRHRAADRLRRDRPQPARAPAAADVRHAVDGLGAARASSARRVAGVVGETVGWRWVFLGLLPLIAISAGIAYPPVRRVGPGAPSAAAATLRERLPLALLVAAGTGLLLGGLTSGQPVLLVVLGAVGALAILALRRLTPPGTLRAARGLPAAVLMRGIITFAFFAVDAYVALALVEWRGLSAAEAGISLTAATLTWTAGSWIQARLSSRYPPERFVRAGLAVARRRPRDVPRRAVSPGLAVAGHPDGRPGRPGHGSRLFAAGADRAARGARRRAGPRVVGAVAHRFARDRARDRHHRRARRGSVRDAGTPSAACRRLRRRGRGRALGLILSGRLRVAATAGHGRERRSGHRPLSVRRPGRLR